MLVLVPFACLRIYFAPVGHLQELVPAGVIEVWDRRWEGVEGRAEKGLKKTLGPRRLLCSQV